MQEKDLVRRLNRLNDLKREIDELSQRVAELEARAQGGAGRRFGAPRGGLSADRMERYALAAVETRDRMAARRQACMEELGRLYAFIDDLEDSRARRVFSLRYIDGLSWQQVAFRIDETDEQTPRRLHNKIIREKILEFDENDERDAL